MTASSAHESVFIFHFLSAFFRNVYCYSLPYDNSYKNCGRYEKTKIINCSNVLKLLRQDGMENYFSLQTLMIKSSFCIHPHNDHSAINFLQNLSENCLLSHKMPNHKKKQNRRLQCNYRVSVKCNYNSYAPQTSSPFVPSKCFVNC